MGYRIAYKAVRNQDGHRVSATSIGKVTSYKPKTWVKPHEGCGPFATFSTLNRAREFYDLSMFGAVEIWKCRIKQSKGSCLYYHYHGDKLTMKLESTPRGTELAAQVMLIEKVIG